MMTTLQKKVPAVAASETLNKYKSTSDSKIIISHDSQHHNQADTVEENNTNYANGNSMPHSTSGYPLPPRFSDVQLLEAQGMPRVASEATTACVMGVAMSQLGRWRREGTGPRCLTDRGGHPAYRRTDVLAFMRSHMDGGRS